MIIATISFIALTVLVAILSINEILPLTVMFICCLTAPAVATCAAYCLYYHIEIKTGKKTRTVIPLTCLAFTVISGVIGLVSYINDHNFILRGLEAQLIWFLIMLPTLVATIVHFIAAYIRNMNELKKLRDQK